MDETQRLPWEQLDEEPDVWYTRFVKHYLDLGFRRSLRRAYLSYLIEEKSAAPGSERLFKTVPEDWQIAYTDWEWDMRAAAFDADRTEEIQGAFKEAQIRLREATVAAVDALILQLQSPRLAVAAAKEILDRGGLPAHSVTVNADATITSDQMAQAADEVEQWEQELLKQSGLNAENQPSTSSTPTA